MHGSNRWLSLIPVLATLLGWQGSAQAANLLTNGDFETGNFSSWVTGGNFEFSQVVSGAFQGSPYIGAQNGTYYATFGPIGADATLSQPISDTAGNTLHISGYVNAAGDPFSNLSWSIKSGSDVVTLLSQTNPNTAGVWTLFSFDVLATGSDTFMLALRDDPAYIALDNFSITETAPVPLPTAFPLFAGGLGVMGWLSRRKKRNSRVH